MDKQTAKKLALAYRASLVHYGELHGLSDVFEGEDFEKIYQAIKELVDEDLRRAGVTETDPDSKKIINQVLESRQLRLNKSLQPTKYSPVN